MAADIAGLSRLAVTKFTCLRRAIDLIRTGGALLILAALLTAGVRCEGQDRSSGRRDDGRVHGPYPRGGRDVARFGHAVAGRARGRVGYRRGWLATLAYERRLAAQGDHNRVVTAVGWSFGLIATAVLIAHALTAEHSAGAWLAVSWLPLAAKALWLVHGLWERTALTPVALDVIRGFSRKRAMRRPWPAPACGRKRRPRRRG
ncbi:hypothetical protein SHKM778_08180 [Streptomyces sp. KM77-8]|uniref:Uncharacterized protein n=1 Tax=Streptomyces haneummycinicus TaxID=3074435 RepID=A0AAT9HAM0_9ACTN